MIEYLIAENPDDRILQKASAILKGGGLVVFPTDTSWVAVCNPFSKKGVEKLYRLKNEGNLKHYSLLCNSISKASEVAIIHDSAFRMIRNKIPGHYTFIFEATKKMTRAVQASKSDKQVGIRFCPTVITNKFIEVHGDVLLSTHIDQSFIGLVPDEIIYSYQLEEALMGKVELVLDPGEYEFAGTSTIVDLSEEGNVILVREGAGKW